jgi:regulatory protein YycI of two-component signal transduction system YycFG
MSKLDTWQNPPQDIISKISQYVFSGSFRNLFSSFAFHNFDKSARQVIFIIAYNTIIVCIQNSSKKISLRLTHFAITSDRKHEKR